MTTLNVTTAVDENNGTGLLSLREAVIAANNSIGDDTIVLVSGQNYQLSLAGTDEDQSATGDLDILSAGGKITILTSGNDKATINAGGIDKVLDVQSEASLALENIVVTGGDVSNFYGAGGINVGKNGGGYGANLELKSTTISGNTGAYAGGIIINSGSSVNVLNSLISNNIGTGIRNQAGSLTVTNSTISYNISNIGGGIRNTGVAIIVNSTISGNVNGINTGSFSYSSNSSGGGIYNGQTLTVVNSTISNNTAVPFNGESVSKGGGIFNKEDGNISINNSTITNNDATEGGGLFISNASKNVSLSNSLVAGNKRNLDIGNFSPILTSQGNNLIGNATGVETIFNKTGDKVGSVGVPLDAMLGPLQNNGGTTNTHALLAGSPAINAGNSTLIKDQRDFGRNGLPDIGAFEFEGINDSIPPTATSFIPTDEGTGVLTSDNLVINFSEPVKKGTGNISIKKLSDNSLVANIDVNNSVNTVVSGNQVTINPDFDLEPNTAYYVEIANGAIKDLLDNNYVGITGNTAWNFQTATPPDTIAPLAVSFTPVDNATGVVLASDLGINFSEPIQKGVGNIVIKKVADNSVVQTIDVATDPSITVNGTQLTINPTADLAENTGYYVEIANGAIKDIAGNAYAGIAGGEAWNFQTQDMTAPTAISFIPTDNATAVGLSDNLTVNFSEPIQKGIGSIVIKKVADNSVVQTIDVATDPSITVNGTQLTINPTTDLAENTGYYVEIANGAIKDIAGIAYAGIAGGETWNFQTIADITVPTAISFTPADDDTDVATDSTLVVNFDEAIQKGTGDIVIKQVIDDSIVETIPVEDANITVNGTELSITPTTSLEEGTDYYVEIADGAVKDIAGNNYAGIIGNNDWNFQTTMPVDATSPLAISFSPADNATKVAVGANLIVNFDEDIKKGSSGNIVIKKLSDNSVLQSIGVTSSNVTVSGNKLTINPTKNLLLNTDYYVEISNGAIKDLANNNYTGIIGKTTWNFKSITATAGPDKIIGTAGDDIIDGLAGNDTITGLAGNDKLTGGDGADLLDGSAGNDTLIGAGGNDVFLVNPGNDRLTGGTGADKFTYNTKAVFKTTAVGVDTITDFVISQNDKIVLDKTTFPKITSSNGTGFSINAEFAKVNTDAKAAISGADIVYNTATGALFYNQNGTASGFGTGGKFAILSNKPGLTENQFIIQA